MQGEEPVAGNGSPQALVEAVRVNDRETMERELAASADLNISDRVGLTALFYACVADDRDLVTRFLNAGANPDAPNQRLTPLWAAARNAKLGITNDLLKSGAKVSIVGLYLEIQKARGIRFDSFEHLPYLWKISKSAAIERLSKLANQK